MCGWVDDRAIVALQALDCGNNNHLERRLDIIVVGVWPFAYECAVCSVVQSWERGTLRAQESCRPPRDSLLALTHAEVLWSCQATAINMPEFEAFGSVGP